MKYHFIAVEGNIGAGKTTLAHMLARHFNARLILEQFADNPFLPKFYENPAQYAFPLELFFMAERYKQLKELVYTADLFQTVTITDYLFTKCLLFAKVNLPDQEFRLYQKLFDILQAQLVQPDILIYLHAPVSKLQTNIRKRNRPYEQSIPDNYLFEIQETYTHYIRQHNIRTLFIDVSNADFLDNKAHLQVILDALARIPGKGNIFFLYLSSMPLELLRINEYRNFIIARFFYVMALRMVTTIIGWRIYEITHNPFAIGLIGLSEFLPAFCLALYAGHVIDKSDKRALLLRTTICYLLCVGGLLALAFGPVLRSLQNHWVQWLTYMVIFCTGVIRAFAGPALNAIIAQIVPKEKLPGAVTINTSAFLFASVTGHATAGFLIAHTTYLFAFSVVGVYVVIAWCCFFSLSPKQIMVTEEKKTWDSIKEGLRFVVHTKEVLGALALDLFAVLFGGAVALIPVYARDILRVGPIGFGWLNAAADVGSIAMILSLTLRPLKHRQGITLLYAVAGFGVCIIVFGLSKLYFLSFLALLCSGMLDGISVVIRGTIVQLKTPDAMRGRVSSVNSMFINSSNELGQFESGVMARLLGVIPSVVFGGCMTIAVVIATWFKAPSLRKMEY